MEDGIGSKIKAARERAGLTQEDLAERMEVSRQAVSKWEADLSRPSSENLLRLCRLLGLDWEELAGETEPLTEEPPSAEEVPPPPKKKGWLLALLLALVVLIACRPLLLPIFSLLNNSALPRGELTLQPQPGENTGPIVSSDAPAAFPEAIALTAEETRDFGNTANGGEKVPASDVEANRQYIHWFPEPETYTELSFYLRQDWADNQPYDILLAAYTNDPEGMEDYTVVTSLAEGAEIETAEFADFEALGHSGCKLTVQNEWGPFTYYFALDKNGVPGLLFTVDSETYETDIDADGENEIITPDSQYMFYDRGMDDYWAYQPSEDLPEGFTLDFTCVQEADGEVPDTPAFCLQNEESRERQSYRHLWGDRLVPGEVVSSKNALTDLLCPDVKDTVVTFRPGNYAEADPDLVFQDPAYPTHRQLAYMALQTLYDLTGVKLERCYAEGTEFSVYLSVERKIEFGDFFSLNRGPRWQEYENSAGGFMLSWKNDYAEYSPIDPAACAIPGETEKEKCLWLYDHARFFQYGEIVETGWDMDTRLFLADGSFFEVSSNTNGYVRFQGPYPKGFSH